MTTRSAQKQKTRRALLDAALNQLSPERPFSSLSLREVAREAGIAPTSFYRHFDDMNDLGLALLEEAGLALRQLMRKARSRINEKGTAIDTSVDTFMEFLVGNANHFRLILREHTGNSKEFRTAINFEISHFITELDEYMKARSIEQGIDMKDSRLVSEIMVLIVFNMGSKALGQGKKERDVLALRAKQELKIVLAGANTLSTTVSKANKA